MQLCAKLWWAFPNAGHCTYLSASESVPSLSHSFCARSQWPSRLCLLPRPSQEAEPVPGGKRLHERLRRPLNVLVSGLCSSCLQPSLMLHLLLMCCSDKDSLSIAELASCNDHEWACQAYLRRRFQPPVFGQHWRLHFCAGCVNRSNSY